LALLIAPVAPFFAEWLFANLNKVTGRHQALSVHHMRYPDVQESAIAPELEEQMELAQTISSLVLSVRKKVNIKVRQPLQKILIPVFDPHLQQQIARAKDIILSEVNVKEIEFINESDGFIKKTVKPDFKVLGKKVGKHMKAMATLIQNFT